MTDNDKANELIVAMVMLTPVLCLAIHIGLSLYDWIETLVINYQVNKHN
jgi:hypothetical protein